MALNHTDNSALTNQEIRTIQRRLIVHGFNPGPVDGILGPMTSAAITSFKRARGFISRAWVGPQTWTLLMEEPKRDPSPSDVPPWVKEIMRIRGWHERTDNNELSMWLKSDGSFLGDPAVLPWCGDLMETAIKLSLPNEPFPGALGKNPYWALNWRLLGAPTLPVLGCVSSITRNGGGHVCTLVGQDDTRFYCLGGNQNNRISIVPIDKSRFVAESHRWPLTYSGPKIPLSRMDSAEISALNFA